MNTKKPLNCYVFSNLIICFLTLNLSTNINSSNLIKKTSNTVLNKIYEKGNIEYTNSTDTLISSETFNSNVVSISNKVEKKDSYADSVYNYVKPSYNSLTGYNLVNYAKNFLGLKYVSAGRSLATGTDCSGFTNLIYKEFGVTLGYTVSSQVNSGVYVSKSDLQPGDLVFYSYGTTPTHVAIYMGDGLIIHESNPRDGVKIASVNIMNYITARRVITSNVKSNIDMSVVDNNVVEIPVVDNSFEEVKEESIDNIIEETNMKIEVEENLNEIEIINEVPEKINDENIIESQNLSEDQELIISKDNSNDEIIPELENKKSDE